MVSNTNKLVIGIFAVIVLYFMMTVAMDISNTTSTCETIEFAANDTLTAAANTMLLYPAPTLFSDDTCETSVGNFTYAAGGYTLGFNESAGTYYGTYDYDTNSTVWGIDFSFILVLVTIAAGLVIAYEVTKQ